MTTTRFYTIVSCLIISLVSFNSIFGQTEQTNFVLDIARLNLPDHEEYFPQYSGLQYLTGYQLDSKKRLNLWSDVMLEYTDQGLLSVDDGNVVWEDLGDGDPDKMALTIFNFFDYTVQGTCHGEPLIKMNVSGIPSGTYFGNYFDLWNLNTSSNISFFSSFFSIDYYSVDTDFGSAVIESFGFPGFDWTNALVSKYNNGNYVEPRFYYEEITIDWDCRCLFVECSQAQGESIVGSADGIISLNILKGFPENEMPNYTVTWTGSQNGSTQIASEGITLIENLPAGDYEITVNSGYGDLTSCSVKIDSPPCSPVISLEITDPLCLGSNNGTAVVTVTGLISPLTMEWSGPIILSDQLNQSNLVSGNYTITITGVMGCSIDTFFTLLDPPALALVCQENEPISFYNGDDAVIDVSFGNGNSPYTLEYSGPKNGTEVFNMASGSISNLEAGDYRLEVTDANGCMDFCQITIDSFICTMTVAATPYNPNCNENTDGSIILEISGANLPIQSTWYHEGSQISSSKDLVDVGIGRYYVDVLDATLCHFTDTFVLNAVTPTISLSHNDPLCHGARNGYAAIKHNELAAPVSILWEGPGAIHDELIQNELKAGDFSVSITGANGCSLDTFFTLYDPLAIGLGCSIVTPILTVNGNEAQVFISMASNNPPYTVSYLGPVSGMEVFNISDGVIPNLSAGNYQFMVTDGAGCLDSCDLVIDAFECDLTVVGVVSSPSCLNQTDGRIDLEVTTSNYPIDVNWFFDGDLIHQGEDVIDLSPGEYIVEVLDAGLCLKRDTFVLDTPNMRITLDIQEITCHDANDGKVMVSYEGLREPVFASWSGIGFTNNTLEQVDLSEGNYGLTLEDANGCELDTSFQLVTPPIFSVECLLLNGESKFEEGDGRIQIIFSGGTSPYEIQTFGPRNTTNVTSNNSIVLGQMIAGSYDILVTDRNNCLQICQVIVSAYNCQMMMTPVVKHPTCIGEKNGQIILNPESFEAPLTIVWYHQGNLISRATDINGLRAGTYRAIVTDDNNCKFDSTFILTDPIPFEVQCEPITNASSSGREGESLISIQGGTGPYTIVYEGPRNGQYSFDELSTKLVNLSIGSYEVEVMDANECHASCQFNITRTDCSLTISEKIDNPICSDDLGRIQIIATGLVPISFNWSSTNFLSNESTLNNLNPGVYNLTVTDANDCQIFDSYVIEEPGMPLNLECFVVQHETAYNQSDGKVTLEKFNGVAPFVIELIGESLIVLDSSWKSDLIIFDSLQPGDYTVFIQDLNLCMDSCSFRIDSADFSCSLKLGLDVMSPTCANAKDGQISFSILNAIGITQMTWQGDILQENFVDSLMAGDYILEVEDERGCKITEQITLINPSEIIVDGMVVNTENINRANGQILASVLGGTPPYQIQWSNGETGPLIDSLSAGEYWIEVIDVNGCSANKNFTVDLEQSPCSALTIQAVLRDATCLNSADGSIRVIPNGGSEPYTYNWSTGDSIHRISNLMPGQYELAIQDKNGCTIKETYIVNATAVASTSIDIQICPGNSFLFGDRFLSESGIYFDTISTQNGCDSIVRLALNVDEIFVDSIIVRHPNLCNVQGSISYGVSESRYELSIDEGQNWYTQQINDLEVGSYPLWIKSHECVTVLPEVILAVEQVNSKLGLILQEPTSCTRNNGSLNIVTSFPFEYNLNEQGWTTSPNYTDLTPGEYNLSYRILKANCLVHFDTTFTVKAEFSELNVWIDSLVIPFCPGDSSGYLGINVAPPGAYQYLWSNGGLDSHLSNVPSGSYELVVSKDGCYFSTILDLPSTENIETAVLQDTYFICTGIGQNITLDDKYEYIWTGPNDFFALGSNVELVMEGFYQLQILDGSGCILLDSTNLVYTTTIFDANFLSPSSTKVGEPFVLVENSWPIPDSIQWYVESDSLIQMNNSANQLELMGNYEGSFQIVMRAFLNDCYVEVVKWVNIVEELEDQLDPSGINTQIISFNIIPNPNSGIFNADVELSSPQTVQLRLYNVDGNIIDIRKREGQTEFLVDYNYPDLPPGVYSLALQTSNEWRTIGLVIQ